LVQRNHEEKDTGSGGASRPQWMESGPDGTFEVLGLTQGEYSVQVQKDDYGARHLDSIDVQADGATPLGDIVLRRGTAVSARILAPDGSPLQDCRLEAVQMPEKMGIDEDGKSGEDGIATIENLSEGTYNLTASCGGLAPEVLRGVTVSAGEESPVRSIRL